MALVCTIWEAVEISVDLVFDVRILVYLIYSLGLCSRPTLRRRQQRPNFL